MLHLVEENILIYPGAFAASIIRVRAAPATGGPGLSNRCIHTRYILQQEYVERRARSQKDKSIAENFPEIARKNMYSL